MINERTANVGDGSANGERSNPGKTTRHAANVGVKGPVFCAKPPRGKFVEKMGKSDGSIPSLGATETSRYLSKVLVFQGFPGSAALGFLIRKNRGHGNRCSESSETEKQGRNGKIEWRSDGTPPSFNKTKDGPEFDVNSDHVKTYKLRPEGFEPPTLGSEDRCAIQLRHGRFFGKTKNQSQPLKNQLFDKICGKNDKK